MENYNRISREEGVPLNKINPGSQELALPADAALRAIASLEGTSVVILGGDVLRMDDDKLTYTRDNWYTDRLGEADTLSFATKSRAASIQSISDYEAKKNHGQQTLYVLVVQDAADR